jgi:hypothetical protein
METGCGKFFTRGSRTSLLWALVQAPFDHTHDRDPHHENATGFAHTHSQSHHSDQLGGNGDDHGSDARSKT